MTSLGRLVRMAFVGAALGLAARPSRGDDAPAARRVEAAATTAARALSKEARDAKGAGLASLVASLPPLIRFDVLGALHLDDVGGVDPRDVLSIYADAVRGVDPAVASEAAALASASLDGITLERTRRAFHQRAADLVAAGMVKGAKRSEFAARVLEATATLEFDATSAPLVAAETSILRAWALRHSDRPAECVTLSAAIATYGATRRLDALVMRAASEQGEALRMLKRRAEAIDAYLVSAEAAHRLSERGYERNSLITVSVLLEFEGATRRARDALLRIVALHGTDVDARSAAAYEVQLARVEMELGNAAVARAILSRLTPAATALGDDGLLADVRQSWISLCLSQGRLAEAVVAADAAVAAAADVSSGPSAWGAAIYQARVDRRIGRLARAADRLTRLRAAVEAHPKRSARDVANVELEQAATALALGRIDEARAWLASALTATRAYGHRIRLHDVLSQLVDLELEAGRPDAAAAHMPELRSLSTPMVAWRQEETICFDASIALARGDAATAIRHAREALDVGLASDGLRTGRFHTYRALAAALLLGRRPNDALVALEAAATILVDATRGLLETEGSRLRAAAAGLSDAATSVLRAIGAPDDERTRAVVARVWRIREIGSALLLAADVTRSIATAAEPTSMAADVPALRARGDALDALSRAQAVLVLRATSPGTDVESLAAARDDVDRAHERLLDAVSRVRRTDGQPPLDAGLVTMESLERTLAPGTAFVEWCLDGSACLAIVVRSEGVRLFDLGPAAGLDDQITAWLELVSTPGGPHEALARRLHDRLIAPLYPALGGVEHVLVMAEGRLAELPFDALLDERGTPLLERFEIASVPSATTYVELGRRAAARPAGRGLVAVADPARPSSSGRSTLPSLVGTRLEIEAITASHAIPPPRVLIGDDATLAAFEAALVLDGVAPWRAVHVACHGWIDPVRPRLGGVLLAGGDVWNVERLIGRSLPTELVVLSACDTVGTHWEAGEGLVGLVRPLLRAGATRVIASAWRVPDRSTAELLADFHRRWTLEGATPGAALRAAKRALRDAGGRLAHPYAWAPFMLWGVPGDR